MQDIIFKHATAELSSKFMYLKSRLYWCYHFRCFNNCYKLSTQVFQELANAVLYQVCAYETA